MNLSFTLPKGRDFYSFYYRQSELDRDREVPILLQIIESNDLVASKLQKGESPIGAEWATKHLKINEEVKVKYLDECLYSTPHARSEVKGAVKRYQELAQKIIDATNQG
jgi:hypothetical protein